MVDTGGQAAWRRCEFLDLFDAQVVFFKKEGDIDHIIESAAGVRADEIGNNGLFFAQ